MKNSGTLVTFFCQIFFGKPWITTIESSVHSWVREESHQRSFRIKDHFSCVVMIPGFQKDIYG
jgi:hypothetical protein